MTPLIQFLSGLRSLGVMLSLDGERLIVNAPKGALTAEMKKDLGERKQEILAFLRESAAPTASVEGDGALSDLPLARSQQRLWFLAQVDPNDPVYNIVVTLRLDGELNASAMERSLRALVDRHESLRTAFYGKSGRPLARVVDDISWKSEFVDLSLLSPKEAESQAHQLILDRSRKPFPLEHAPLFRAALFRIGKQNHRLLLVVHHIIADGWSLGILARELSALYSAFVQGESPALPEIAFQYRDFVRWEREVGEEAAARQLPFWLDRLRGTLPVLELPGDRRRPANQTSTGNRIYISIKPPLTQQFHALCRDTGATPFMLLLAAFKAVLARYTGLEDILVGSGTSNRQRQEFAPLVGFFVNNLVMRTDLSGNPNFLNLLERVKDTALSAYAHQDLPFSLLVEKLQPERSTSHSPLIQVLFIFQNLPMQEIALPGLKVAFELFDPGIARADLSIEVWPLADGYRFDFEYNTDIFDESTMRAMQEHYLNFLSHAIADPTLPIANIPLLSKEERQQILVDWNDTAAEYPSLPVHKVFEQIATASPDAVALSAGAESLTYRELNRRANSIAHYLSAQNLPAHSFIAVSADGDPRGIAALLGILKAGHAYVPVDGALPIERIGALLAEAGVSVLLAAHDKHQDFLSPGLPRLIALEDVAADETDESLTLPVTIDDSACLIFPSGPAGATKGVVLPHRGIVRLVKNNDYAQCTPDEVHLQLAPLSFDPSMFEVWGALLNGGRLVLLPVDQRGDGEIGSAIRKHGVTTLWLTAAVLHRLIDEGMDVFRPLRQLLVGGDILSASHADRLLRYLPHLRLIHCYGPTENSVLTCCHRVVPGGLDTGSIPVGKPIRNTRVFILDALQEPVPVGVTGELYAAGDGLATGYWNAPGQTAERFIDLYFEELGTVRAYRTNDLARYRSGGVIELPGRKDKQVRQRGYRVDLTHIEQALLSVPGVQAVVVSMKEAPDGKQRLVAYLVSKDGLSLDPQKLRASLRELLSPQEVPGSYLTILELPLTAHGLIDFEALDALPVGDGVDGENLCPPPGPVEVKRSSAEKKLSLAPWQGASKAEHPLSRSQQRLWFLDQLDPGNPVYNISAALRMNGPLSRNGFEEALKLIVERHESLRTVFRQRDGSPYALVEESRDWQMEFVDISSMSKELRDAEVMRFALQEAQKPFALDIDSLFRVSLLQLDAENHVAVVVMHHMVSDGWSMGVMAGELGAIYASLIENRPFAMPHPALQFRDFVAWERKQSESSSDADMQYWRQQLAGELPLLELPVDHPRRPQSSLDAGHAILDLPTELSERLQKVSRAHDSTLFMVLLAAFNVLLWRYSGQEDILVGTPTANRLKTEFEGMVGFFVNSIVLRTSLSGNPTFVELLRRVQTTVLEAFEHQSIPFDQLVEVLQPERSLDRSPIFQVLFTLQNAPLPQLAFGNVAVTPIDIPNSRARYDLAVDTYLFEGKYRCRFEYNAEIFDEATMKQMQQHLLCLLYAVASNPATSIRKLPMLSSDERHRILEEWNNTQRPLAPFASVPSWFRVQAAQSPDVTAVRMGERALTYAELDAQSTGMARTLRAYGVGKGAIVGLYLNRSVEMVVGLLAILKTGAAYLPLDPALPAQRVQFLLDDSDVPLVITEPVLRDSLSAASATLLAIDDLIEPLEETSIAEELEEPGGNDLAYLIYTSGSTGTPKGTEIQHSSLVNLLASMLAEVGLRSGDTLVAVTTLSFDIAGLEIFGPLVCGATLVLASREEAIDPEALAGLMADARASVVQATPSTWRMLVDSGWMGQANLRMWCGGEALPADLAEKLLGRGRELWNLYGPTESTIWSAAHRVRGGENPILIGRPIANTRMYILDADLQPVPAGVAGELFIAGAGVARGYWRLPELTATRFLPDPFDATRDGRMYRTGDLARYRNDGQIQVLGRTDHQVKLRGHRIELGEIEAVLERHAEVLQAVVALHGEGSDQQLIAYIRPASAQVDIAQLRSWLQSQLPAYMVPSAFYSIEEIPLTPNGKIDRGRLPQPTVLRQETAAAVIAPRNRTEEQLAKVWCEILGVSQVSIRDNFFEAGGHSLLLIRIHVKLRQDLGFDVAVVDLFRYPTIESLAASLRHQDQGIPLGAGARSR